jgi:CheY-like chemotaxis protein
MPHKLLLADDSVTIQRVIELTFADEDVEVTTVGDGQLAIERLDADHFDIVLADVDMPKRDGYEVAAYVKSRPKLAHIPVVLLTGAFEPIDQARADAAGSSDVLAKPFEPQMVINRVKQLLGNKKADGGYEVLPTDSGQHGFGPPMPTQQAMAPRPPAHTQAPQEPPATGSSPAPVSLDDYFDQLDAAFSNLQPASPVLEQESTASAMDWSMPDCRRRFVQLRPHSRRSRVRFRRPRPCISQSRLHRRQLPGRGSRSPPLRRRPGLPRLRYHRRPLRARASRRRSLRDPLRLRPRPIRLHRSLRRKPKSRRRVQPRLSSPKR